MSESDAHGRALEYVIVEKILKSISSGVVSLTDRADKGRSAGAEKFISLPGDLKTDYFAYADSVFVWLESEFKISSARLIKIDRISDNEGRDGDVTDIRLNIDGKVVNLSVKYNHTALKHQRPSRTAVQCGFEPKGEQDKKFREDLEKIYLKFQESARKLDESIKEFNQLKLIDEDFIDNNLYYPVCNLVADFINHYNSSTLANFLFKFLVGNTDFYKLRAEGKKVFVSKFAEIETANSVVARVNNKNYVIVEFSNGWIVNMRLHTAATLIGVSPSLKFDSQSGIKIEETEILN